MDSKIVKDERLIPLSGLGADFPADRDAFALSYAEAVSAVDFLVRRYGRDAMVRLIRSYASGVTDAEAFQGALGVDDAGFGLTATCVSAAFTGEIVCVTTADCSGSLVNGANACATSAGV